MKSMTTTPEVLNEASVNAVAGADIITLPYERDEKPKLIPPRYHTLALYEEGGDYPEESIW
ncbi:hypothetical protein NO989_20270 [Alteromonas sp. DY56-G5]|uniref:hypothetical protein n=1 Tax=Alteromonas sp. DY56-G5 TaxID=2967128 RepID=UPI0026232EB8|nr:hypothetical protein [uncultured Thalassolituus sp.]|tara:strand:- start:7631 stop:7813 length:183 start_codon:yes stop_codon:yes gene_type:complete